MLLKDLLKDFIAPNTNIFQQMIEQKRLDTQFRNALNASNDEGVIWIRDCVDSISKNWGAMEVIKLGEDLSTPKLDTNIWENLYSFALRSVPFKTIHNLIMPDLQLKEIETISSNELISELKKITQAENSKYIIADINYQLINEEDVPKILEKSMSHNLQYYSEKRDCDDFSRIIRGWLSMIGLGNLTLGTTWYKAYNKNNKYLLYHSVVVILYKTATGEIKSLFAEPQKSNKTWATDGTPSGMFWSRGVDRIEADLFNF